MKFPLRNRWLLIDTTGLSEPLRFRTKRGAQIYQRAFLFWASNDRFVIRRIT